MFLSLFLHIYIHIPVYPTAYFMKIRNIKNQSVLFARKALNLQWSIFSLPRKIVIFLSKSETASKILSFVA